MHSFRLISAALVVILLSACSLPLNFKEPAVTVTSVKALPDSGSAVVFEIVLKVVNPNDFSLELEGVA